MAPRRAATPTRTEPAAHGPARRTAPLGGMVQCLADQGQQLDGRERFVHAGDAQCNPAAPHEVQVGIASYRGQDGVPATSARMA